MSDRDRDRQLQELVGRTVGGKYTIIRLIGQGGMGAVYEAEHGAVGKHVALKFIGREWAKDEQVASRFAREARAANAIDSEHIVSVFDAGTDEGRPYLVMELLRGEDLGGRLRRLGRIPAEDALHVVAQILRGLSRAHEAGIVHRDLKPDNVFLTTRNDDELHVKIVDFGISKISRPKAGTAPLALTHKGVVLGTPFYMAPEQAQAFADVDGRADLYSVGAILFECLTGRPPHTGETYEQVIVSICMRDAPDLRAIVPATPAPLAELTSRALARDRAERYQSAAEMLSAVRRVAPNEPAARPLVVPLMGKTILSHGAISAAGGPPTDVSWTAGAPAASLDEAPARSAPDTRPRRFLVLTAILATLTGLGLTLWLVSVSNAPGRGPPRSVGAHSPSVAAPASAFVTSSPSAAGSAAATPSSPAVAATDAPVAPVVGSARPSPAPAAQPLAPAIAPAPTAKPRPSARTAPLDIQRDLP